MSAGERRRPGAATRMLRQTGRRLARATAPRDGATSEATRRFDHMRGVAARVTHFLAPSNYFCRRFIEFGIPPERITHSQYGFDHRPFHGLQRRSSNGLRIGFLGSLMVSKAPHLLLEAYKQLPVGAASIDLFGGHVDYHGDPSYRGRLEPLLIQDGVQLHGSIPHDRIPQALTGLDLLVVPSIWPENSPLVIQEAFLAGVPVVASRIGDIPEVVSDGINGLLFDPGDAADLHRVLERVLSEPELLPSLRRGLPPVRTIEEDVAFTRALYATHLTSQTGRPAKAKSENLGGHEGSRVSAVVLSFGSPEQTALTHHNTSHPPMIEHQ